jgi:adenylate cyclase
MGADEEGTHLRLKAHFGQLVYPKINNHGGRIVKNTGDGLLAEFPSVLGAVRCAVEIQRGMIPIGLNSIATISIFAHWPLDLRAEATT